MIWAGLRRRVIATAAAAYGGEVIVLTGSRRHCLRPATEIRAALNNLVMTVSAILAPGTIAVTAARRGGHEGHRQVAIIIPA